MVQLSQQFGRGEVVRVFKQSETAVTYLIETRQSSPLNEIKRAVSSFFEIKTFSLSLIQAKFLKFHESSVSILLLILLRFFLIESEACA